MRKLCHLLIFLSNTKNFKAIQVWPLILMASGYLLILIWDNDVPLIPNCWLLLSSLQLSMPFLQPSLKRWKFEREIYIYLLNSYHRGEVWDLQIRTSQAKQFACYRDGNLILTALANGWVPLINATRSLGFVLVQVVFALAQARGRVLIFSPVVRPPQVTTAVFMLLVLH